MKNASENPAIIDDGNSFKRFRELTRMILQVPKSEVTPKLKARVRKRSRNKKNDKRAR